MANPVVHWQVVAKDAEKLRGFYADLFDWKTADSPDGDYIYVHTQSEEGISGGIGQSDEYSGVTFYVRVPDIDAALEQASGSGAEIQMPATEAGGVKLAIFADPEGNSIGLIQE